MILEFTFYLFMEVLMYGLGRIVIPILTFGRARAFRLKEICTKYPYMQDEGGKMLVPEWMTVLVGFLTFMTLITIGFALL